MSTIASLRTRVLQVLMDLTPTNYTADQVDEAIRQALEDFTKVRPVDTETVLTLPAAGREVALDALTDLLDVFDVWWPYDTSTETWPPNQVRGWRVNWDDGRPVLFLFRLDAGQPQAGELVRVWYTRSQTIQGLDGAAATTLPADRETSLVNAAAGYAALSRAIQLIDTVDKDVYMIGLMGTWGKSKINAWKAELKDLRGSAARSGPAWGLGWALDKWDSRSGSN